MVGGVRGNTETDSKMSEFRAIMGELGSPLSAEDPVPGYWSIEEGMHCFEELRKRGPLPTALIAINDLLAIGIGIAARRHGVRVPEDLSLAGFDDIYWSRLFEPNLTTVSQNYKELAGSAVKTLLAAASKKRTRKNVVVPARLVTRDSCGPPA